MTIGTLTLPDELEARLDGLARSTGKTKTALILTALEEWLEDQEDVARADEVMQGIRAGTVHVLTSEEVWKRLGLES